MQFSKPELGRIALDQQARLRLITDLGNAQAQMPHRLMPTYVTIVVPIFCIFLSNLNQAVHCINLVLDLSDQNLRGAGQNPELLDWPSHGTQGATHDQQDHFEALGGKIRCGSPLRDVLIQAMQQLGPMEAKNYSVKHQLPRLSSPRLLPSILTDSLTMSLVRVPICTPADSQRSKGRYCCKYCRQPIGCTAFVFGDPCATWRSKEYPAEYSTKDRTHYRHQSRIAARYELFSLFHDAPCGAPIDEEILA